MGCVARQCVMGCSQAVRDGVCSQAVRDGV